MDSNIAGIVTVLLGLALVWGRAQKIILAIKECADVLSVLATALGDQKLTEEEVSSIKKEAFEAIGAIKGLVK